MEAAEGGSHLDINKLYRHFVYFAVSMFFARLYTDPDVISRVSSVCLYNRRRLV